MFKLFKSKEQIIGREPIYDTVALKNKPMNEIIEEIHESFYTEVDKLLVSAKISKSLDTDKKDLIDKCERLRKLGFSNSKEVKEAEIEIDRLNKLKIENQEKQDLIEAINYFGLKYPNYKFITEESVKNICQKYNLVYGSIDKYIGTVPDKNLKHIEDFKINEEDLSYQERTVYFGFRIQENVRLISFKQYFDIKENEKKMRNSMDYHIHMLRSSHSSTFHEKCNLEIAAPLKDFNMTEHEIKDFKLSKIEIPDPVVLQPIFFKDKKHYLIVTAWGLEGGDELVVNQKFN